MEPITSYFEILKYIKTTKALKRISNFNGDNFTREKLVKQCDSLQQHSARLGLSLSRRYIFIGNVLHIKSNERNKTNIKSAPSQGILTGSLRYIRLTSSLPNRLLRGHYCIPRRLLDELDDDREDSCYSQCPTVHQVTPEPSGRRMRSESLEVCHHDTLSLHILKMSTS